MLVTLGTLLGGLGIFLLAVSMITDGLKLAAGRALRDILARSTRTPVRGIASGFLLTSVVLSSSAVTIATIGFVNAGLLGLKQAMSIILGATIGTTMMGWLVSIV
ncbi:MAG TPA: MFS transporter, partial [Pseudohongiella sp.]|nr:MFS transporter [Pseudohongiella sp.]